MNSLFIILYAFVICCSSQSEGKYSSAVSYIYEKLEKIESNMRDLDRFKLVPTENMYTFLKLDTATGRIEQLQWNLETNLEFCIYLNDEDLSLGTGSGTFELYPTKNMYQFILLDKAKGRQWHVQWHIEENKRWIRRFY